MVPGIIRSFQEYKNWNVTVWTSDLVLFNYSRLWRLQVFCRTSCHRERIHLPPPKLLILQPPTVSKPWISAPSGAVYEITVSIDFYIQYRYACSAARLFTASGRTTEKNKEETGVCMCVYACPCVWRGVHGGVCYRSDIKGRNKDSSNSSLVGKMQIQSMACGISPKCQVPV